MIRDKRAEKRDHCKTCSINTVINTDENEPIEIADTIGPREANARLGIAPRSDAALAELGMNVADVMAQLPNDLRDLCVRLQHSTVSEIARDMGVPRTTVSTAVARLREYFEKSGMRRYLEKTFQISPSGWAWTGLLVSRRRRDTDASFATNRPHVGWRAFVAIAQGCDAIAKAIDVWLKRCVPQGRTQESLRAYPWVFDMHAEGKWETEGFEGEDLTRVVIVEVSDAGED